MDKKEIIFLAAVLLFVAIRLYQKYFHKKGKTEKKKTKNGVESFSLNRNDDYEPYSGK
jgi:hypothetical protein